MESDVRGYAPGRTARWESGAGCASSGSAGRRRRRKGFALVEVIVVLVILAILAAIAIPALTGYIDKARDKQYIAEARNVSVAMKTLLNEDYASGRINNLDFDDGKHATTTVSMEVFTTGDDFGSNAVLFDIELLSVDVNRKQYDYYDYYKRAAALIGETYPADDMRGNERCWGYQPVAKKGSEATAATADGFVYVIYPEGDESGASIVVTYKLQRPEGSSDWESLVELFASGVYDANAGYEIYDLTDMDASA